ncbi:MAG: succinylglutamate desuccinylase/aspartoacylase family protein [Bacteroidia bacterium]
MSLNSEHLIAEKFGEGKKQLLIAIGAMHGNERAGIEAIERVFKVLNHTTKKFNGGFIGIKGNLLALRHEKRYIKNDLNRIWTNSDFEIARKCNSAVDCPDHYQLKTLKSAIDYYTGLGYEEIVIIDLHTTSATGGVFIACPEDETHVKMIKRLHVPVILNLADDLNGTAMQHFWDNDIVSFAFEGGNHYNPDSANKMESALWLCLEYLGHVDRNEYDNVEYHDLRLIHATEGLPHFCKIILHHKINKGDNFRMEPGFTNFQPVSKGTLLAQDINGDIFCPEDCFMLMPLYQEQGSDGFFLVKQL